MVTEGRHDSDCLHGFAEAHLIRNEGAAPVRQHKLDALPLEGQQLALQPLWQILISGALIRQLARRLSGPLVPLSPAPAARGRFLPNFDHHCKYPDFHPETCVLLHVDRKTRARSGANMDVRTHMHKDVSSGRAAFHPLAGKR